MPTPRCVNGTLPGMRNHFDVHRWTRPTQWAVLALPPAGPAGDRVRAMVAGVQARLGAAGSAVRMIPPEWLHVTLATVTDDDPDPARLATLAAALARRCAAERDVLLDEVPLPSITLGRTGLSLRPSDTMVPTVAAGIARAAADEAALTVTSPATPHLGLAYATREPGDAERAALHTAVNGLNHAQSDRMVGWAWEHLVLVQMTQDLEAGYYTWATRTWLTEGENVP